MILTQTTPPAAQPVTLAELKAHLRLAHGFADEGAEDGILALHLGNAVATIEAETAQALIARAFRLETDGWDRHGQLVLPVGPVASIDQMEIVSGDQTTSVTPADLSLSTARTRQTLSGLGGLPLTPVPDGGRATLSFTAGYGPAGSDVPGPLRQAVLLLAAQFYENRAGEEATALPGFVSALLQPYRPVRL
ncbi:MAG: head-tail connector protein [Pseudomonadota bacterium]